MNPPFSPMRLPEAGPLSPPEWEWPEPPEIKITDAQIIQRIDEVLCNRADTAFGEDKKFWESSIIETHSVEWAQQHGGYAEKSMEEMADKIRYINAMLVMQARELLNDDRVPIELMIEEGLV